MSFINSFFFLLPYKPQPKQDEVSPAASGDALMWLVYTESVECIAPNPFRYDVRAWKQNNNVYSEAFNIDQASLNVWVVLLFVQGKTSLNPFNNVFAK